MPADPNSGLRFIAPLEQPPSSPDPAKMLDYLKYIHRWAEKVRLFSSGVPGGWKGDIPNETAAVGDPGTEAAGWMAADATIPQGIVESKGDLLGYSTEPAPVPVGADGFVLGADSTQALGVRYLDPSTFTGAGGGWARHFLMLGSEDDTDWPLLAPDGTSTIPIVSFAKAQTAGLYRGSTGGTTVVVQGESASGTDVAGKEVHVFGGASTGTAAGGRFRVAVSPGASASGSSLNAVTTIISAQASGQIDIGNVSVNTGAPGPASYVGAHAASGRTDTAGGATFLQGGKGTGTGNGGTLSLSVAPPDSATGSSQNTLQTGISISGVDANVVVGGIDFKGTMNSQSLMLAGVDRAAGVTDGTGGNSILRGGQSTGTGAAGAVKIQLAPPAAATASTQNALVDVEVWDTSSLTDPQSRSITLTGTNGGTMVRKCFSELLTLSTSGTTTDTSANLLPAGAIILAVNTRVTTTISGGGVTAFSVGDGTTAARFSASAAGLSSGSTRIGLQHQQGSVTTDAAGPVQASAAKARITTDATPSAGVVRIAVWALVFTAPTS